VKLLNPTADLITEIAHRFQAGDAAADLLGELAARVDDLRRQVSDGGELPPQVRAELNRTCDLIQGALTQGTDWLARTAAGLDELTAEELDQRLRRTYGLPSRAETRTAPTT
jgi:hypothetical protein